MTGQLRHEQDTVMVQPLTASAAVDLIIDEGEFVKEIPAGKHEMLEHNPCLMILMCWLNKMGYTILDPQAFVDEFLSRGYNIVQDDEGDACIEGWFPGAELAIEDVGVINYDIGDDVDVEAYAEMGVVAVPDGEQKEARLKKDLS